MTVERREKRDHRIKARNPADRRRLEAELKPERFGSRRHLAE
jgi:hypothetical protein